LQTHPLIHGYVLEDESHTYREMIQGKYRVIYRVEDDTVFIVTLHYAPLPLAPNDLAG
jgi:mRNA-degrading endonuclease RelE of RelBE toxin-antitoxin system